MSRVPASRSSGRRQVGVGLALVGILLIGANLRASLTTVGPLIGEIRADLELTSMVASALVGLPLICFAVFSPIAPRVATRFGLERTLGAALLILAVGIVARSVPWLPALWLGTVLLGLAIALANVLLPSLLKRDFPLDAGRYTGAYSAVQSVFAALAAGVAVPVAGMTDAGWRLALGMWAGLALVAFAVFSPRLRGGTSVKALATSTPATATDPAPESAQHWSPWCSPTAWMITVAMGTQSTLYYVVITWWPEIEQAQGISANAAGVHVSVLQLCGIIGNLGTAAVLQRWQRDQRGLIAVLVPLNVAGLAGMLLLPSWALLWSMLLGMALGSWIVFCLASFSLRTRNHHHAASLSGMAQSFGYLLAALGPFLLGGLHDATGSWTAPLVVLLCLQVVQLISAYGAARPQVV
ncbi:MAG TPA: MFS transporter [Candidatus Ruania gallistercoris]|uniref:MFS transporter n=1 Tax=Candidatus Ruania gallistercoris TaxID=2838746 RepID=A0A9D2ECV6_9MICO|nr:MFS transporter [Candidatus Ruania gallistercoris]